MKRCFMMKRIIAGLLALLLISSLLCGCRKNNNTQAVGDSSIESAADSSDHEKPTGQSDDTTLINNENDNNASPKTDTLDETAGSPEQESHTDPSDGTSQKDEVYITIDDPNVDTDGWVY